MRPISQELAKKMDIKKRQRIFQFHNWDGSRPMAAMASGRPWSTFRMRLSGVVAVERCAEHFAMISLKFLEHPFRIRHGTVNMDI